MEKSLDEIIAERIRDKKPVLRKIKVKNPLPLDAAFIDDKNDVEKSLEEIIKERKIENPSKHVESKSKGEGSRSGGADVDVVDDGGKVFGKSEATRGRISRFAGAGKMKEVDGDEEAGFKRPFLPRKKMSGLSLADRECLKSPPPSPSAMDMSLDDMIDDSTGMKRKRSLSDLSDVRKKAHTDILNPVDVLNRLSRSGLVIEFEIAKLLTDENGIERQHTAWRATYKSERIISTCEAPRRLLAKEAAALHFIMDFLKKNPHVRVPKCAIPDECFIHPTVYQYLEKYALEQGWDKPIYSTHQTFTRGRDWFVATCDVGGQEYTGMSYMVDLSKIAAAKMAYESLSQRKLKKESYKILFDSELANEKGEVSNLLTETIHHIDVQSCSTIDTSSEVMSEKDMELLFTGGGEEERKIDKILRSAGLSCSNEKELKASASKLLSEDSEEWQRLEVRSGDVITDDEDEF